MNIYSITRKFAQITKSQNLFTASKEINGIRLFKNTINFSKLQEFYLSWLYSYDLIYRDLITEKISKHVTDNELFTDSYLLWRKEKKYKHEQKDNTKKDVHLIAGNKIIFPKR
jgi:hypothetical protein